MNRLVLATLLSMVGVAANATVLTFDDIPGQSQNTYGDIGTYKGFAFNSTLDWLDLVGSNWNFGAHSGDFGILNNSGGVGIVTKVGGSDFTFDGLWAKTWANGSARQGMIAGYNNGSLVWSSTMDINGATYSNFAAKSGMIDALHLDLGDIFLVDDIALDQPASDVPEPASLALLGLGLAGIAAVRRKQA